MLARLIGVFGLAGIILPAGAFATGSIGIRLADGAPDAARNSLARVYVVDRLAPGSSVRRRVEISNSTSSTANVMVYAAAANLRQGRFAFAPGHSRNELSKWTSMSRRALRLPAGSKALETVTIKVPKNASSGERYAVIWAEVSAASSAAGGVTLVNRVGVRMYVSIGPGGAPSSNFIIGALHTTRSRAWRPVVFANVRNTGRRTLDISGNLKLSKGPSGLRAGPFRVGLDRPLAPGASKRVAVRLDKSLPRGPWRAQLRLRSGVIQRVATATIRFPRHAATPIASAGSGGSRHLILFTVLIALLALAALAVLHLGRLFQRRGSFPPMARVRH